MDSLLGNSTNTVSKPETFCLRLFCNLHQLKRFDITDCVVTMFRSIHEAMADACFTAASPADLGLLQHSLQQSGNYTDVQIQGFLQQGKVRRYLPDSKTIAASVTQVMLNFWHVVDTINQPPLLTSEVWAQFFRNLKKVQEGLLSGEVLSTVLTSCLFGLVCQHCAL